MSRPVRKVYFDADEQQRIEDEISQAEAWVDDEPPGIMRFVPVIGLLGFSACALIGALIVLGKLP
jgi:hypothetical protein